MLLFLFIATITFFYNQIYNNPLIGLEVQLCLRSLRSPNWIRSATMFTFAALAVERLRLRLFTLIAFAFYFQIRSAFHARLEVYSANV